MRAVSYHLIDLVQNLGRPRILVLGDLILDRYTWGDAERISQEAPVILLRERSREVRLGGAANVANMLRGLEADVSLAGVVGNDADGRELRDELERQGVDCASVIVDPERPTTMKERFIGPRSSGIRIRFFASTAKSAARCLSRWPSILFNRCWRHCRHTRPCSFPIMAKACARPRSAAGLLPRRDKRGCR